MCACESRRHCMATPLTAHHAPLAPYTPQGTGIPVASVATGFPSGQVPLPQKLDEIRAAVEDGAREIDIVISRTMALTGDWEGVYREVCQFKEACGPVRAGGRAARRCVPSYAKAGGSFECPVGPARVTRAATCGCCLCDERCRHT